MQKLLGILLNNIILKNDSNSSYESFINFYYNHPEPTFNYYYKKNKTTESAKTTDDTPNIFSIPSTRENLDIKKYGEFLIFMIKESLNINTTFANASDNNNVDILTAHHISNNSEDYKAIEELKTKYLDLYPILNTKSNGTSLQNQFPDWILLETTPPVDLALKAESVCYAIENGYLPYLVLPMATLLKKDDFLN